VVERSGRAARPAVVHERHDAVAGRDQLVDGDLVVVAHVRPQALEEAPDRLEPVDVRAPRERVGHVPLDLRVEAAEDALDVAAVVGLVGRADECGMVLGHLGASFGVSLGASGGV
jgi:hypothetical protein